MLTLYKEAINNIVFLHKLILSKLVRAIATVDYICMAKWLFHIGKMQWISDEKSAEISPVVEICRSIRSVIIQHLSKLSVESMVSP